MSRTDVLVGCDWVQAHQDHTGVVIVEVDEDTTAYDAGHIAGAVRLDWRADLQDPVRRDFVDRKQFEQLLSSRGVSDDATGFAVDAGEAWLRLSRLGPALAFHASTDGERWDFVRLFRVTSDVAPVVGFLSQAPMGTSCDARFDAIRFTEAAPEDLRDGS